MNAPIVFFDIAGPDMAAQSAFYQTVFGWNVGAGGMVAPTISGGGTLSGALRADPADKVIYLGVEDVTATLAKIAESGGGIDTPRFVVPGVVIIGLFRDPAGNRMGLVETKDGAVKIP